MYISGLFGETKISNLNSILLNKFFKTKKVPMLNNEHGHYLVYRSTIAKNIKAVYIEVPSAHYINALFWDGVLYSEDEFSDFI